MQNGFNLERKISGDHFHIFFLFEYFVLKIWTNIYKTKIKPI